MKLLTPALLLLGAASTSYGYNIHSSCNCNGNNLRIKEGMEEAKAALQWSGLTGVACAAWERSHEMGDGEPSMYETCKDQGRRSILDDFFGNHGATAYEHIANALQPAAKAAGDFSESVDSITIVCGDAQLNRITNSVWRDRDRQYARVEFNPAPASDQRPCDIVEALAYPTADGTVIMLCDRPGIGVNKPPTFSWMNTKDVTNRDVDLLGQTISADLTHELIHIGNFAQFPRVLGGTQAEVYKYEGCKSLADSDLKWKNCDTFAIIARVFYLNNYFSKSGKLKPLPNRYRPTNPNKPPEVS